MKTRNTTRNKKTMKAYAGIVDGCIHTYHTSSELGLLAIYERKKSALNAYEYVVPVTITYEVKE